MTLASSSPAPAALSSPPAYEVSPLDDESFAAFESFCIVCDRVIKPLKEKEPVKPKKKCPAGTIRVKNPDGTVTTRTANGQKTTRPPLRRGPSSNSRLAVACANNAATKLAPLTQANAAAAAAADEVCLDTPAASASASKAPSPRPSAGARQSSGATVIAEPPFASAVYCSRACAQVEEARSNDAVRRVSFGHPSPRSLGIITSGLGFSDPRKSPHGPPSPLFISGSSDSSSNTDAPLSAVDSGPACSAPTAMEFFRMTREGPDDAWREVNRQRRSSVHPNSRPNEMIRQLSQASTALSGEPSSDSLSSMWQPDDNGYFSRPASGSGKMRVLPLPEQYVTHHRSSTSSDRGSAAIPTASRPIPRSGLSQVSLTASSPGNAGADLPAEFGSAPQHTLSLWNNYHASFPSRDSISSSASSYKAYAQPGTYSPAMSPPPASERKNSIGSGLSRPLGGTIRAKSRTDVTWDSFGREEIMARSRRTSTRVAVDGDFGVPEHTPKQSFETATGASAWPEKYVAPPGISAALNRDITIRSKSRASFRSTRSTTSDDESSAHAGPASFSQRASFSHQGAIGAGSQGLPIPMRQPSASALSISPVPVHANASSGRTPRNSVPRHSGSPALLSTSSSSAAVPDLASLRIGATGACVAAAGATAAPGSAPKSQTLGNYNWDEFERKGGKTYELPKALKVNPNKAGLFFFPTK